jgi:MFS family permease
MKRVIIFSILLGVVGLVLGYLLFGKFAGEYIDISLLISDSDNLFKNIEKTIAGVEEIRRKILIMGGAGFALGLLISIFFRRKA